MTQNHCNNQEVIPLNACRFTSNFELKDNGDDSKSAPFRMVARTGDPVETAYFGRVVHDLSGMRLKGSRVSIDYQHDPKEIIGFANHFNIESGDLEVAGALTPNQYNQRAEEVIALAKSGVPFEASINFGGDGIKMERVEEGETVSVNSKEFTGPGMVIREWPLRNIAITPLGQDGGTSVEFNADNTVVVDVLNPLVEGKEEMAEESKPTDEVLEAVDSLDNDTDETEEVVDSEDSLDVAAEAEEAVETDQPVEALEGDPVLMARKNEAEPYMETFGDRGAFYFASGLSLSEAMAEEINHLRTQNAELAENLTKQNSGGEAEPCSFSNTEVKPPKFGKLGLPKAPELKTSKDLGV